MLVRFCPVLSKTKRFGYFLTFAGILAEILGFILTSKFFIFEWFSSPYPNYHIFNYPLYLNRAGFAFLLGYVIVLVLSLVSAARTILTDPGFVSKIDPPEHLAVDLYECNFCKDWKPPRAHHCSVCQKCVMKMDHHCPWVSNCVGVYNQKFFFLYLNYTGLLCVMTMTYNAIGGLYYFLRKAEVLKSHEFSYYLMGLGWSVIGLLIALIFGLTILGPFLTVIYNAVDNQTTVECEQDVYGVELDVGKSFSNVMGDDSMLLWLLPITPTLQVNYLEMLYTYQDPKRKKPQEEPIYYPKEKTTRGKYELAIWALAIAISIYSLK